MSDASVIVARLIRPRGNRGELAGEIYSSQPGRAEKLKEVVLELEGRRLPARVEEVWFHDGRPVFKFEGIDSISAAEAWAGADVLVSERDKAAPGEGEFSHADLIGCQMTTVQGQTIGVVKGVEDYGGAPLLKVVVEDGREILVPFARSICTSIDVNTKIIRVDLPEGLVDL